MEMPEEIFDKVVKIAQARGFVFNASSIYGGLRSSYDYGPLGVLLKNNISSMWWSSTVSYTHLTLPTKRIV